MSRDVVVGIEIACDGDDCDERIIIRSDDVSHYPQVDITDAKEKGWDRIGDKDYCPVCLTER